MYAKIHDGIWQSLKRKQISSFGKELFIYFFSCPHHNIVGLYRMPLEYVASDLGEPLEKVKATVAELLANGLITYDVTAEVLLVNGFLEHNPLVNTNAEKSAISRLSEVPDTPLFCDLLTILERFPNSYGTVKATVTQRLRIQKQNTEAEEQKQNTETENIPPFSVGSPLAENTDGDSDPPVLPDDGDDVYSLYNQTGIPGNSKPPEQETPNPSNPFGLSDAKMRQMIDGYRERGWSLNEKMTAWEEAHKDSE